MKNTLNNLVVLVDYLVEFKMRIQTFNNFGLYDPNKLTQSFCCSLLNYVYENEKFNFINLDKIQENYPAVDIGDKSKKIAYQITSQNDVQKITETIDKFIRTDDFKNKVYSELRFLILNDINWTTRQKNNIKQKFKTSNLLYIENNQIIELKDIEREIRHLKTDTIDSLIDLFKKEFGERDTQKDKFDLKLFKELDNIINENLMRDINYSLSDTSICYHPDRMLEAIELYLSESSLITKRFNNPDLQNAHELFILSLKNLSLFLSKNYYMESYALRLHISGGGYDSLIKKDELLSNLNSLLQKTVKNYSDYRQEIKNRFYL